ncbi:hypothetical protein I5E68_11370 [Novosphingobium sp. YJ-S2-02]|uniref:Uncharacterized protein n=1 Tax=Novosphingobium aureum TaxID=2792964 RepID=A0A931HDS9_9SPHN|nr:hypothetical protein [Novosphingobium aureum]MBH0113549.1 hypothetical protein [Novosphingobium aureum]
MEQGDQIMLSAGAVLAIVAAIASLAERRRMRRRDLDRVGFMPWTGIFLIAFLGAVLLIGLGGRHWLTG